MNNKVYIGIDIGLKGAICIRHNEEIITYAMPTNKKVIDIQAIKKILNSYNENMHVVFEKLGVIYGSSKTTAFSMGYQSGLIEGLCSALNIPYTMVRAVDWQKDMFTGVTVVNKPGKSTKDTKAMALTAIKRLHPDLKLTFGKIATKPHDGLIDSVLMTEYAIRKNL